MYGRCKECGQKAYLNPYYDSPYYCLCFVCQLKKVRDSSHNEGGR